MVTAAALGGANLLIGLLEDEQVLDTRQPDDLVHHVEGAILEQVDGAWRTTAYAQRSMVPGSLPVEREPERLRLVVSGGSFAMGTPYAHQRHGEERAGGLSWWLRTRLAERLPEHPPELLNLAGGGQSSTRVLQVLEQAMAVEPDLVLVASCNNEGSLAPNLIERSLRQMAGVRFLSKLLQPGPTLDERPLYTLQDTDYQQLQAQFERNLAAMARITEARGVPLLLATLPVNLRYEGGIPGTLQARSEGGPLRSVVRECRAGDCPWDTHEPCVGEARALLEAGQTDQGRAALEACDDLEALRWLGLLSHSEGEHDTARQLLAQYAELVPRGRCRPGLNQAIRELAARHDGVLLLDLDARSTALSADGIADQRLFVDNCHMSWVGYGLMAEAALEAMEAQGLIPPASTQPTPTWELGRAAGLPPVAGTELVGGPPAEGALPDPRDPWGERKNRRPPATP